MMDPARYVLCDFVATSHKKFSQHFADFQQDTGDFMIDLATKLADLLSSEEIMAHAWENGLGGP